MQRFMMSVGAVALGLMVGSQVEAGPSRSGSSVHGSSGARPSGSHYQAPVSSHRTASSYRTPASSYRTPVSNYRSSVSSYRTPASSYRSSVSSYRTPASRVSRSGPSTYNYSGRRSYSRNVTLTNYHVTHGHKFQYGYSYAGKYHGHWNSCRWNDGYGCWVYHDPCVQSDYYYCVPDDCYYPVSYSPYDCYSWNDSEECYFEE